MKFPQTLENFIKYFSKLPGIGRKTAERLGFYILSRDSDFAHNISLAVHELKDKIRHCEICGAVQDTSDCPICSDTTREQSTICVVENAMDIYYIESTESYHGLYHCLGGVLSPLNGITPDDLRIDELLSRVRNGRVLELIFATSPTTEGDTTVLYIKDMLPDPNIKITHLARGIPVGTDLQYAGNNSLAQAMKNREVIK